MTNVVEIVFKGTDNVSDILSKISSNVDNFGSGLGDFSQPFLDGTKAVLGFEAALAAMVIGGLTVAVQKSGEFKSAMAEVNTMISASGEEFAGLSNDVLNYGTTSTASLSDITGSLYNLVSMNVDYKDSMAALSEIEKLSVATKADMKVTTDTLIGTMNAYGAGMDEAGKYSDAFFTIVKDGKTTMPELSQSIAQVTSLASVAGIPFETLGAAIAAITASGAPTSQAITMIKASIQAIIKPTDDAKKAAAEYGVDLSAAALKSKGFDGVLKDIYTSTNGNVEAMGRMIPSVEGFSAVAIIGADKSGIFKKALEDMAKSAGVTTEAYNKMKDNLDFIWKTLGNSFDIMFIKLGNELEPKTKDILKSFTSLFNSIGNSINADSFDPVIDFIKQKLDSLDVIVKAAAKNLPEALKGLDFKPFLDGVQSIFDAFGINEFDLTSVEGLRDLMQTVIDGMGKFQLVVSGIIEVLLKVGSSVGELLIWFTNLDDNTVSMIGNILALGTALAGIATVISIGGTLLTGFSGLAAMFSSAGTLGSGLLYIISLLSGPVGIAVALAAAAIAIIDFSYAADRLASEELIARMKEENKVVAELGKEILKLPTSINTVDIFLKIEQGDFKGAKEELERLKSKAHDIEVNAKINKAAWDEFKKGWEVLSKDPKIDALVRVAIDKGDFKTVEDFMAGIETPTTKQMRLELTDGKKVKEELEYFVNGERRIIKVNVEAKGIDEAKKKLENLQKDKFIEIKLKGEIDKELALIKASAETTQKVFEWTAKLNIAEVEAQADIIKSAYESINVAIKSTGDLMAQALGALDSEDFQTKWAALDILRDEAKLREKAFDLQKKLTEAEVDYIKAKTEALNSGESLITIDSNGLEPALEMVMWEIVKKAQLKANESASEFLLGA